jgi:hypothetical protein
LSLGAITRAVTDDRAVFGQSDLIEGWLVIQTAACAETRRRQDRIKQAEEQQAARLGTASDGPSRSEAGVTGPTVTECGSISVHTTPHA